MVKLKMVAVLVLSVLLPTEGVPTEGVPVCAAGQAALVERPRQNQVGWLLFSENCHFVVQLRARHCYLEHLVVALLCLKLER